MIANISFNLPEEEDEFNYALNGKKIGLNLSDFYNLSLRHRLKYLDLPTEQHELIEQIRNEFVELFGDYL